MKLFSLNLHIRKIYKININFIIFNSNIKEITTHKIDGFVNITGNRIKSTLFLNESYESFLFRFLTLVSTSFIMTQNCNILFRTQVPSKKEPINESLPGSMFPCRVFDLSANVYLRRRKGRNGFLPPSSITPKNGEKSGPFTRPLLRQEYRLKPERCIRVTC